MFDSTNLPKLIPGTSGYALPRPGVKVVACLMPETRELERPASWGPGAKLTGLAGKHWHCVLDLEGDNFPNDEFEAFYELGQEFNPGDDPRADFLFEFWGGYDVTVYEAEKTKPASILGITVEAGEIMTPEGPASFDKGDLILRSPSADRTWPITAKVFLKKYDDQGIRQGTPPSAS